ncbi:MAG: lysylphosphatidylglycerol synthase transmembrane domain-containing protein [Gaiellales bacterium]
MSSLQSFWHATTVFAGHLADVRFGALAIALALSLTNLGLRSVAWRNILQAGYTGRVKYRSILAAYLGGVGMNAILPARGGDVMKVYMAHRSMPGATYTTITSSLVAETLLDAVIGPTLLILAYTTGRIPKLPVAGHLATWEWSFFIANGKVFGTVLAVVLIAAGVFFTYLERRVTKVWDRIKDGFAIVRTPRRYARLVLAPQLVGWVCRAGAMYWFLQAFGIPATWWEAALALSAGSASTLLPFTPGGLGPQQALLGYMFRNAAPAAAVLSFSVGMQFAITLTYAIAGGIAIGLSLRRLPWKARVTPPAASEAPTHT